MYIILYIYVYIYNRLLHYAFWYRYMRLAYLSTYRE